MTEPPVLKGKVIKEFIQNPNDSFVVIEFEDGSTLTIETEKEVHYQRKRARKEGRS